jgi:hypothetical protein
MWKTKYRFMAEDNGGTAPAGGGETPASDSSMSDVNSDWADLSSDVNDSDVSVEAPAITTEPLAAPAAPVVTPPAQPAVAAEPQVVQPQQPQPSVVNTEAQQPTSPLVKSPEEIAAMRAEYVGQLTQSYQLSPEEAQMMQTQPELVIPRLAADLHVRVLDAVAAQLPQRVYGMVNQVIASQKAEQEAENEFFKGFEDLRAHRDAVLQVGKLYRAANPTASKETAIAVIGNFVRTSLGLPTPGTASSQPVVQQAANPFIPAQNSGGGNMPPAQQSLWEAMLEDDD